MIYYLQAIKVQEYDYLTKGRSHEEKLLVKLPLLKIWAGPPPYLDKIQKNSSFSS